MTSLSTSLDGLLPQGEKTVHILTSLAEMDRISRYMCHQAQWCSVRRESRCACVYTCVCKLLLILR